MHTGGLLFYPEKLVKDDVITGSVKLFYPDPENRFSLSTWQICFFILIQNAFLSGFLMRSKKFRSLDWKRIKKRIFTQWNPDKKDTLSCDWRKNQKTSFWRIRIKKRNWPCDDVIFHRLFRIKKLPPPRIPDSVSRDYKLFQFSFFNSRHSNRRKSVIIKFE